jgi:hypothetical protein
MKMDRDFLSIGVPFVAGGAVFLLIAFATGIVTLGGTSRTDVAAARIDERATICFDAATAHLNASGKQAGQTAAALAQEFTITSGDKGTDALVQEECRKKLGE